MLGPAPAAGRVGLADGDPAALGAAVLASWDAFLDVVRSPSTDLARPSRLPGWSGRDACVHLGSWDDAQALERILAAARAGDLDDAPLPDATNDALVRAHRGASDEEVVDALVAARDRVARFFTSDEVHETGRLLVGSTVGPLPVLGLLHAGTYELAVHALDLAPCGAPAPSPPLLDRGLAALIDVTGSLAARARVDIALTAMTPAGGWRFVSDDEGWTTEPVAAGPVAGVGVRGTAVDLLDASAGRAGLPQLLVTRRLQVHQLPQWMRLAPLLEQVPGLPGGAALRTAVSGLSGISGRVGRLLGRRS